MRCVVQQCDHRDGYAQRRKPDMGGFVWNNGVEEVMWSYTPQQLPVLNGLAAQFAVSDEWFSSMPGATDPNRAFAFTGSAMGTLNNFQNGFLADGFDDDSAKAYFSECLKAGPEITGRCKSNGEVASGDQFMCLLFRFRPSRIARVNVIRWPERPSVHKILESA